MGGSEALGALPGAPPLRSPSWAPHTKEPPPTGKGKKQSLLGCGD